MAISMTRAEYEAQYGVAPVFGAEKSKIDTSPSPTQMTRAEYKIRFGVDPFTGEKLDNRGVFGKILTPTKESFGELETLYGGSEQGIAQKLKTNIEEASKDIQAGRGVTGVVKAGLRSAGDVAKTIFAPIGAAINIATFGQFNKALGQIQTNIEEGKGIVGEAVDYLADIPAFQEFAVEHPNAGEDFDRAMFIALSAFETGKIEPKTALERTKTQIGDVKTQAQNTLRINKIRDGVQKTTDEIANIENNYAKLRKANEFSKDNVVSRERIAKSGVLNGVVDDTGTIRTKQKGGAVEQYRKLTLGGSEKVVRNNLVQEGKMVNLSDVSKALTDEVMASGLEGADLRAALTGITREINGLKLRADAGGNIKLEIIHDAKINTTNNINYQTPPETATYRKAVARAYKTFIENNSGLPIKEINTELSKYLGDIKRLENLDGRKVKGGKLGKYTSQITGTIIGGAVGGAVAGWGGVAFGTIISGEIAAFLKGRVMSKTFGEVKTPEVPKSPILEQAKKGFTSEKSAPATEGKSESKSQLKETQSLPNDTTIP